MKNDILPVKTITDTLNAYIDSGITFDDLAKVLDVSGETVREMANGRFYSITYGTVDHVSELIKANAVGSAYKKRFQDYLKNNCISVNLAAETAGFSTPRLFYWLKNDTKNSVTCRYIKMLSKHYDFL